MPQAILPIVVLESKMKSISKSHLIHHVQNHSHLSELSYVLIPAAKEQCPLVPILGPGLLLHCFMPLSTGMSTILTSLITLFPSYFLKILFQRE